MRLPGDQPVRKLWPGGRQQLCIGCTPTCGVNACGRPLIKHWHLLRCSSRLNLQQSAYGQRWAKAWGVRWSSGLRQGPSSAHLGRPSDSTALPLVIGATRGIAPRPCGASTCGASCGRRRSGECVWLAGLHPQLHHLALQRTHGWPCSMQLRVVCSTWWPMWPGSSCT